MCLGLEGIVQNFRIQIAGNVWLWQWGLGIMVKKSQGLGWDTQVGGRAITASDSNSFLRLTMGLWGAIWANVKRSWVHWCRACQLIFIACHITCHVILQRSLHTWAHYGRIAPSSSSESLSASSQLLLLAWSMSLSEMSDLFSFSPSISSIFAQW